MVMSYQTIVAFTFISVQPMRTAPQQSIHTHFKLLLYAVYKSCVLTLTHVLIHEQWYMQHWSHYLQWLNNSLVDHTWSQLQLILQIKNNTWIHHTDISCVFCGGPLANLVEHCLTVPWVRSSISDTYCCNKVAHQRWLSHLLPFWKSSLIILRSIGVSRCKIGWHFNGSHGNRNLIWLLSGIHKMIHIL